MTGSSMKQTLILLLSLILFSQVAFAQSTEPITDAGEEDIDTSLTTGEDDDGYNRWSDPLYYQFEKMMPELAESLGRLNNRLSTLAVTSMEFSPNIDQSFRRVAVAKLYGQLLLENPRLKLIKCNECDMVRSEIKNGILTVTRGLTKQDDRRKLAKKLGVQGFMTAMVIEQERQLSIVVNVYDAEEGQVILSDVITGTPVPETTYYSVFLGRMTVPVKLKTGKTLDHYAWVIGSEKLMRFTDTGVIYASLGAYQDQNDKLEDGHVTLDTGLMFDGSVGWEPSFLRFGNSFSFTALVGLGQFISTQFNFAVYTKVGIRLTFAEHLVFNIYNYSFDATNLEQPTDGSADQLTGSATFLGGEWLF